MTADTFTLTYDEMQARLNNCASMAFKKGYTQGFGEGRAHQSLAPLSPQQLAEQAVLEELSGLMDTPAWEHVKKGIGKILGPAGLDAWWKFEDAAEKAKAEWEAPEEVDADERRAARGCEAYHAAKDDAA